MTPAFEPLIAPAIWVTLAVLSLGVWGWYAFHRPQACPNRIWWVIMLLTGAGLLAALLIMLNPIWLDPLPPPAGKPLLTVLVDRSDSMTTIDGPGNTSRWEQVQEAAQDVVERLESRFEVRVMTFDQTPRPASADSLASEQPAGKSTDLAAPIIESLVSDRPQGQALLLLSDGVHNAQPDQERVLEAAGMALSWDAPIYTATFGTQTSVNDVSVRVPRSQELVFVGQSVPVTVEVHQNGSVNDRVDVTLESSGEVLATKEVRLSSAKATAVSFLITPPEIGLFQYQVKLSESPREATGENNAASFQVRVVEDPVQALVLEGKPYWDAKFLLRMLTNDPALEVDCLVRVTADRFLQRRLELSDPDDVGEEGQPTNETSGSPDSAPHSARRFERQESVEMITEAADILEDAERLSDYQVLLLGREAEAYLSDAAVANLRSWLSEQGGSLICYRGSPVADPDRELNRLLPIRWRSSGRNTQDESRFRVEVTERGDDLNWLRLGGGAALDKLPSLATAKATDSIKPLAVVLGRGHQGQTTAPVLTYQPYGMGKVVVIEGAGMWRWAFLPPKYQEHEPVYGTLWQSLLRWVLSSGGLLPGEEIALQMDRVTFSEGEAVSAIVLRREEGVTGVLPNVELSNEQGELLESYHPIAVGSEPGVYQVFLGPRQVGHYKLRLGDEAAELAGTRSMEFDVRPDLREHLEVSARPEVMSRIAEVSGGAVLEADDLSQLADTFEAHLQQSRPGQYRRVPAWDRWWVLAGVLLVWTLSWSLRRSHGLI